MFNFPEKPEKDALSHEAHELFMAHKEDVAAKEKEGIAAKEREGRILHESLDAFPAVKYLLEYGLLTKDMTVEDALGLMEETIKEIRAKYKRQADER